MKKLPVEQARKRFKEVLDRAEHKGIPTTITRHGTPAALVLPAEHLPDLLRGLSKHPELVQMGLEQGKGRPVGRAEIDQVIAVLREIG